MEFNPGDGSGIVDEIDALCDSNSTSYPIASKTRRVNIALEIVEGWIRTADGTWQFDDENYSTIPEGTTDLVDGQSDYSFANTFLDIDWVKIMDIYGHWHILKPIDQSQVHFALEEMLVSSGFPEWYDKVGDTIRLYRAPNATIITCGVSTGGLKVGFKRAGSEFATTDTTKTPGFASPYHVILAYMGALPYCMSYKKDRVAWLNAQIGDTPLPSGLKKQIIGFYGKREQDKRKAMTSKRILFR